MILDEFYIRMPGSTKPPHWLLHLVPKYLHLQEISYQTYVNGVATSLHQNKKELWPPFPLITKVCKIDNFKHAKDEVSVLASYKFKEVTLRRHGPQEASYKFKEVTFRRHGP